MYLHVNYDAGPFTVLTVPRPFQEFISRETGLEPSSQQLLLPGGGGRPVRAVDTTPAQPALQCWAPPEVGVSCVALPKSTVPRSPGRPGLTLISVTRASQNRVSDHQSTMECLVLWRFPSILNCVRGECLVRNGTSGPVVWASSQ